jgi:hypothetical protein
VDTFSTMMDKLMGSASDETLQELMKTGDDYLDDFANMKDTMYPLVGIIACKAGIELQRRGVIPTFTPTT